MGPYSYTYTYSYFIFLFPTVDIFYIPMSNSMNPVAEIFYSSLVNNIETILSTIYSIFPCQLLCFLLWIYSIFPCQLSMFPVAVVFCCPKTTVYVSCFRNILYFNVNMYVLVADKFYIPMSTFYVS